MNSILTLRVAARFQKRLADQPTSARKETKREVTPINKPKGISRETTRDYVKTKLLEDSVKPNRKDLQPKDVFKPLPKNVELLDYVRKGWPGNADEYKDMEQALRKQVPKDKGYDTVSDLSQYLIKTDGGGDTRQVGRK